MAGKLSPAAQGRLNDLGLLLDQVHRAHSLVEQYATAKANPDQYVLPMARQFTKLKMLFMGAGFDAMSQLSASMELAAKRGLSPSAKARVLREGVGSLKFQIELEQRSIVSEEVAAQQRKADKEQAQSDGS